MSEPADRARGWGVGSVVSAALAVVLIALVIFLSWAVDHEWGYLIFPAVPVYLALAFIAVVLGVIGLVVAARQRRAGGDFRRTWALAAIGVTLGAAEIVALVAILAAAARSS
ncbi:hypothetical protein [Branchiibius hedensis]|nr:hypothetical protein [Branchiibius hedensis]